MARKILIIDDEDDIREVAALSLESVAGWEVVKASSGAQGLARAEEHQPDAILLDVMMPGMDGPTTFRELRNNQATAGIPVLLLTAKVQGTDQRRFADLGVEAVLFKPFDPMTLSAQIALRWAGSRALIAMTTTGQPGRRPDAAFSQAMDGLWVRFLPEITERVAVLEAAAQAAREGALTGKQREAAQAAAHKLAGVLGTFGLTRGTVLARELELTFARESSPRRDAGVKLAEVAAELRSMIENRR